MVRGPWALLMVSVLAGCAGRGPSDASAGFEAVEPLAPLSRSVRAWISVVNPGRRVRPSAPLVIELKLVNVSTRDAMVCNQLEPGRRVVIEILRADGAYKRSPVPKARAAKAAPAAHYVLPPGGFVGRRYAIEPTQPAWHMRPGRYSVRLVYRNGLQFCPASPSFTEEDITLLKEKVAVRLLTGMIVSNVDTFQVVGE